MLLTCLKCEKLNLVWLCCRKQLVVVAAIPCIHASFPMAWDQWYADLSFWAHLSGLWLCSQLANFSQLWSKICHLWDQCKSSEKMLPCKGVGVFTIQEQLCKCHNCRRFLRILANFASGQSHTWPLKMHGGLSDIAFCLPVCWFVWLGRNSQDNNSHIKKVYIYGHEIWSKLVCVFRGGWV